MPYPLKDFPRLPTAIYRGPGYTIDEIVDMVARIWPEEAWPFAASTAFAEVGLATSVVIPGNIRKTRLTLVWSRTLGDLHLQNDQWGPSVGAWQIRQHRAIAESAWPLDLEANCRAALALWEEHGPTRWSSYKHKRNRPHLPETHRAIARWCESHPNGVTT
jgi:hypothetical protein